MARGECRALKTWGCGADYMIRPNVRLQLPRRGERHRLFVRAVVNDELSTCELHIVDFLKTLRHRRVKHQKARSEGRFRRKDSEDRRVEQRAVLQHFGARKIERLRGELQTARHASRSGIRQPRLHPWKFLAP